MRGPVCEALWILDVTCGQIGTQGKARTCGRNFGIVRAGFGWHGKVSLTLSGGRCSPWGQDIRLYSLEKTRKGHQGTIVVALCEFCNRFISVFWVIKAHHNKNKQ